MRLPALVVLSTALPFATACLEFIGTAIGYSDPPDTQSNMITANMYDNGAWICAIYTKFTPGVEHYMTCVTGKYAWVKITYPNYQPLGDGRGNAYGPAKVLVAYARDGQNFRFTPSVDHNCCICKPQEGAYHRPCASELSARIYGCSSLMGFAADGTYSDGEGEQVSVTADVVVTGIETAAGAKAT